MLELTLTEIIDRTALSMHQDDLKLLIRIGIENENQTLEQLYPKVLDFIRTSYISPLYDASTQEEIISILTQLQPLMALYCTYYAKDYLELIQNPQGTLWSYEFIKNFYNCDTGDAEEIYRQFRSQIQGLPEILYYPDPLFTNPGFWKANAKGKRPHIYSGQILKYLQNHIRMAKTTSFKSNVPPCRIRLLGITPSVSLLAIKTGSHLPNGTYTNKSSFNISAKVLKILSGELCENAALLRLPSEKIMPVYIKEKLSYDTQASDSCLINQALSDDLFRVERINRALDMFVSISGCPEIAYSRRLEKVYAGICSLLITMPIGLSNYLDKDVLSLIKAASTNNEQMEKQTLKKILGITNIIIPYLIGMLCYLLFCFRPQKIKNTTEMNSILELIQNHLPEKEYPPIPMDNSKVDEQSEKLLSYYKENANNILNWIYNSPERVHSLTPINDSLLGNQSDKLLSYIKANNDLLPLLSVNKSPLWHDHTVELKSNKGKTNANKHTLSKIEWKNPDRLSFSSVLGIMLNQQSNIAKSRTLMDENYWRYCNCINYIRLIIQTYNFSPTEYTRHMGSLQKISPNDYANALANAFYENIHSAND